MMMVVFGCAKNLLHAPLILIFTQIHLTFAFHFAAVYIFYYE